MGIFSDILIDIEDMWSNGKSFDEIAKAINKQYGTAYTEAEVDAAVSQILEDQDQRYNDDMDGDFVEPVAWINVEKRKLEWNTDFPVRWETPTVVKLDKLPLYTTPPSVDALIGVDELANIIRAADGNHSLGAGALAEKIIEAIRARGQK